MSGARTPAAAQHLEAEAAGRLRRAGARRRGRWSGTSATFRTWSSRSSAAGSTCSKPRRGQRSGHAAVRIACEMVDEGLISEEEAVADSAERPEPAATPDHRSPQPAGPPTTGLPASPGAACGTVVFDADHAEQLAAGRPIGHPGPARNVAGRLSWYGRSQGSPDRPRWHDVARRGRSARHGQAVRRGRDRAARRSKRPAVSPSTAVASRKARWITVDGALGQGVRRHRPR